MIKYEVDADGNAKIKVARALRNFLVANPGLPTEGEWVVISGKHVSELQLPDGTKVPVQLCGCAPERIVQLCGCAPEK